MSRRMGDQRGASGTELVHRKADGPVSTTVVRAMAEVRGTSTLELPPLADAVDPEALDTLCAEGGATSRVAFDYAGYRVGVEPDRTVTVVATGAGPRDSV